MTEAGWTREKPTVAGWYWTRARPSAMATILYFDGHSFGRMDKKLATTFREYVGPITPDSYQQGRVAGLREAGDYAKACKEKMQQKIRELVIKDGIGSTPTTDLVDAKALQAHRIAVWCEQAAQDEKEVGDGNIKMS